MARAVRRRLKKRKINIITKPSWDSSQKQFPVKVRQMTEEERREFS